MFSHATMPQISLSPAYRHAQRQLARWLDSAPRGARHAAFDARAALGGLDGVNQVRLARWLAWLCVAARSRGRDELMWRVERLDAALGAATAEQLRRLPGARAATVVPRRLRHSA